MKINLIITALLLLGFVPATKAQDNQNSNTKQTDDVIYKMNEVDQKTEIVRKPEASTDGYCKQSSGLATIYVVFHKSGKITKAALKKSSGCRQFDENALQAARKIKFKPALKNKQPVTVATIVEYTYQIH
ncbi:MAG: energy transducer TonB [Pyrinomonadaceae bacterium]